MQITHAKSEQEWESFLKFQEWSPFLQSWTMGKVYESIRHEVVRLEIRDEGRIVGICQAVVVPARRGKHLAVSYGPVFESGITSQESGVLLFVEELKRIGKEKGCAFVRMSPFHVVGARHALPLQGLGFKSSPLHMLAEHIWYLNLIGKSEADILAGMRKNTRNLIRRAEKEGVTITRSQNHLQDLSHFLRLIEETRKRHHFTPYTDRFFRAQVEKFSARDECALYLAHYKGEVVATSIHMIYGGETSYHHGASTVKHAKCYASYLLQWTAIQDALKRGDKIYNFWGIAPEGATKHPFAGVTTFKRGFGGQLLELEHCRDLPLSPKYWVTFGIEQMRKIRRGF